MLGLLALLAFAASPNGMATNDTLAIGDVWARHHELDGKIVRVAGMLKGCDRWTCVLAEGTMPNAKWLSIGHPAQFDWESQSLVRHRLIVEGRFSAKCLHMRADPGNHADTVMICTDAGTMLHDSKILRVQ